MVHQANNPWDHQKLWADLDQQSVRRGHQIYRQVCSACHGLEWRYFREMVNNGHDSTHYKEEAQKIAAEYTVQDKKPDSDGKTVWRPGKLSDKYPHSPYENKTAARVANNGAYPPQMTWLRNSKQDDLDGHTGEDYIFSLLLGYMDPPAGVTISEDGNYNPYFYGGAIAMAPPLYSEIIQYEDGTPATLSQLAFDISNYLTACSRNEYKYDKIRAIKLMTGSFFLMLGCIVWKRQIFAGMKTAKMSFRKLRR